jgi:hypothetical protein
MKTESQTPFSFYSGFALGAEFVFLVATIDVLKEAGSSRSSIMRWSRDSESWAVVNLDWTATKLIAQYVPDWQVTALGVDPVVAIKNSEQLIYEEISPAINTEKNLGHIRDIQLIDNQVYVVGMGRQIYKKCKNNDWILVDPHIIESDPFKPCGFNSISGVNETSIYAAGFAGEIWRAIDGKWQALASPTKEILNKVKVIDFELVFIAGQNGTLLRGSGDVFEVIKNVVTEDSFWGMEWFQDALYLATTHNLYRLGADSQLHLITNGPDTCGQLHAGEGILFSIGIKNVCWTADGIQWFDITP